MTPTPCPKCGEMRKVEPLYANTKTYYQVCRNGCENWTAAPVGTYRMGSNGLSRGGPRGQIAELEK